MNYDTLRIALTHEDSQQSHEPLLSFDEIRQIAKAAVTLGVSRFEIAGGEPLEREDIPILLMMLSSLTIVQDMTLTTNGILLPRWAKSIRGAGIRRVTVRLDTFDPVRYRMLTGGDLTAVLAGIRALMEVGFPPTTLEVRLLRGINDGEIASLVNLTKMTGISLRFMELTDAEADAVSPGAKLPCSEVLRLVPALQPEEDVPGVYRLPGAAGSVALIPCDARAAGCLTLSADGILHAHGMHIHLRGLDENRIAEAMKTMI